MKLKNLWALGVAVTTIMIGFNGLGTSWAQTRMVKPAGDQMITIKYSTYKFLLDHSIYARDPHLNPPAMEPGKVYNAQQAQDQIAQGAAQDVAQGQQMKQANSGIEKSKIISPEMRIKGRTDFETTPRAATPLQQHKE